MSFCGCMELLYIYTGRPTSDVLTHEYACKNVIRKRLLAIDFWQIRKIVFRELSLRVLFSYLSLFILVFCFLFASIYVYVCTFMYPSQCLPNYLGYKIYYEYTFSVREYPEFYWIAKFNSYSIDDDRIHVKCEIGATIYEMYNGEKRKDFETHFVHVYASFEKRTSCQRGRTNYEEGAVSIRIRESRPSFNVRFFRDARGTKKWCGAKLFTKTSVRSWPGGRDLKEWQQVYERSRQAFGFRS